MPWTRTVPPGLVRGIGVAEVMGGIGLILPLMTGVQPWLTPLAAVGIALIMLLAAVFHASRREFTNILPNLVLAVLAGFVAYGRGFLSVA